jgi:hypothetical protein
MLWLIVLIGKEQYSFAGGNRHRLYAIHNDINILFTDWEEKIIDIEDTQARPRHHEEMDAADEPKKCGPYKNQISN